MSDKKRFTRKQGLNIQKAGLKMWKKVLTAEAYEHLKKTCSENNKKTQKINTNSGFDILRGGDIDNVVKQYAYSLLSK